MNVDLSTWNFVLLTILNRISTSHAVSIDLELSGIPVRGRRNGYGRQSLQERYSEVREAAKKFSILQVGLTLIEEDAERDVYVLRTYNFNISPLLNDNLGVEREFTYSSSAVNFLLGTNYRMESPFSWGIPYLTRIETAEVKENHRRRHDRAAIPPVRIRDDDTEALELVERVKEEIVAWKKTQKPDKDGIVITGTPFSAIHPSIEDPAPLNNFERRLVHQLVRSEFPELRTHGRKDSIFVQYKSETEEADYSEQLQRTLKAELFSQRGFAFITEGLAGADFANAIDTSVVGRRIEGEPLSSNTKVFERRIKELEASLKQHQTILIGHNCFLDLAFIYQKFYGELPETVEEFQEAIHKLFPLVVDTKFMATSPITADNRGMQLFQINAMLSEQPEPKIVNAHDHPAYLDSEEKLHEAGYDSYITAKTFLRLASRLEASGSYESPEDEYEPTEAEEEALLQAAHREEAWQESKDTMKKKENKRKVKVKSSDSKFSHLNVYDALLEVEDEVVPVSAETLASTSRTLRTSPDSEKLSSNLSKLNLESPAKRRNNKNLLPPWSTHFWNVYGNKLRVFGTVEEVCDLTQGPKEKATEDGEQEAAGTEQADDISQMGVEDKGGSGPAQRRSASWSHSIVSYFRGGQ